MTISINPYADVLNFPPGTPPSVINAVLGMRARADAQQAQPSWVEQGVNNIINGATNKLVFPFLQNEFVNLPYQTDLETMKTDQNIRQYVAQQANLTSEEKNRLLDRISAANDQTAQFGGAIDQFGQMSQPTPEKMTDTGPTQPYGPFEDPWSTSPGPQFSPPLNNMGTVAPESGGANIQDLLSQSQTPTQIQGDVAPVNRDRVMTYTPEKTPNIADTLKAMAGSGAQGTLNAGLMAEAFAKSPSLLGTFDPLKLEERQKALALKNAQQQNVDSQRQARDAELNHIIDNMVLTGQLKQEQAALVRAQAGIAQSKGQEEAIKANWLENLDPASRDRFFMKGNSGEQKPPAMVAARMKVIQDNNPGIDPGAALAQAIKENDMANPMNNLLLTQAKLPVEIARNEIPKLDQQIRELRSFDGNLDKVNEVMQRLATSGLLPADQSWTAQLTALKNRALHPDLYNADEVNGALEVVNRLKNGISVGYDRQTLGDKGARVAPAYNLPKDPSMISPGAWNGYYSALKQGLNADIQDAMDTYGRAKNDAMGTRLGSPQLTGPSGIQGFTPPPGYQKATPPAGYK